MKNIINLMLLLAPIATFAAELEVDPAHSSIQFDVKHLVVSTVVGNFTDFAGTLSVDEKDFTKSKFDFTVKTNSINTLNAKRDGHLKSADFFDVEKFAEAKFVSKQIKKDKSGKNYDLIGEMTLHGVTKSVTFQMSNLGTVKDPYGVQKSMFKASTVLKRKDFGLVYNAPLEKGGLVIGEDVNLTVNIEAAPKVAAK